ncbi:MAG: hypothetical protein KAF64_03160 [Hydrogenophaga sp.]|uniref:hypothetical protein n=1 Tax=Hydrogenophaga sp. TaxID=1904254 RepID=UPI0025C6C90C|nr:hypothetical protein [Hydrogenophaga sp.]MBU7572330.1 hypothetical protein [Hydrogenophaga sp.]
MRSWLAVFLWVLLPLQFSWAAMGGTPAPHEREPQVVVHCPHSHCATNTPGLDTSTAHHADCGTCHNGCPLALFQEPRRPFASAPAFPLTGATVVPASRPADLPDRPQWSARG